MVRTVIIGAFDTFYIWVKCCYYVASEDNDENLFENIPRRRASR